MTVELTGRERRRYFGVVTVIPLLGSPLAVNGGPVFQILAIENLGLSAEQVGLAVGLGAISIPFQIMAARIPLQAAHRNLRIFIWLMSIMCLIMAWLITGSISAGRIVVGVIVIAVLAELAVSVLFATSFQPLLSTTIDSGFRQRLNSQGRAVAGLASIALIGLVSWSNSVGRVVIVVGLALLGAVLAATASTLRRPTVKDKAATDKAVTDKAVTDKPATGSTAEVVASEQHSARGLAVVYLAIGISVIPAWPFIVTYASATYWPAANLGAVGAALAIGRLSASASWRPTTDRLIARAQVGSVVVLICALALVALDPAKHGWVHGATVLVIITVASAAGAVVAMALLEMAHHRSSEHTTVAVLTRFDIIASTSMQFGFLVAGYLIDFSVDSDWPVDPFQLSLIGGGALLVAAVAALGVEARPRSRYDASQTS